MSILEFIVITLAPSLTLGIVLFLAKNWFLERLKNSIKHEYDISLEKFKGELKSSHDKELEDLKAFLKKQTDINLEDYRFQIELRKKWVDDFRNLSSIYLDKVKENVDIINKYIINDELALNNVDDQFNNYKQTLNTIGKIFSEQKNIKFKIELLIFDCGQYGKEINNNLCFIENWLTTELVENFVNKIAIDFQSEKVLMLKESTDAFKINVMNLLAEKSNKL
ncbi:hypothetical protein KXJ74_07200 [Acinetobacter johnsonii]|nr:hypothetical protein KXJ74_07200 [Acinetobacter johnsonii]